MRSNGRRAAIEARLAELDSRHTELEAALAAIEDESASRVDELEALASGLESAGWPAAHVREALRTGERLRASTRR